MYETRLGLAKHSSPYDNAHQITFEQRNCPLEGQVADMADRIAYNGHDLEDGMRAGLITDGQLEEVEIFTEAQRRVNASAIEDMSIRRTRTAKTIIDMLVSDCIDTSKETIDQASPKSVEDVYSYKCGLVGLSAESEGRLVELEKFLFDNFYMHGSLKETAEKVKYWLGRLFEAICKNPGMMADYYQHLAASEGLERTVCDYIAGMTDSYCLKMLDRGHWPQPK